MRSRAGYENALHSDPRSSAAGLSYNTFHRGREGGGGEGGIRCMERQREREKMKLNKKSGGGEGEDM